MSSKEMALATIRDLPEDVSWEEIAERIRLLSALEEADGEISRGEGIPHEKVRNQFEEWVSA